MLVVYFLSDIMPRNRLAGTPRRDENSTSKKPLIRYINGLIFLIQFSMQATYWPKQFRQAIA
ncbi:hypothetical protein EGI32_21510 [Ferruginibacter sp. HRS2-29]|nr:hypothetical protein [Ferruginibacter sp. HRS2-29]